MARKMAVPAVVALIGASACLCATAQTTSGAATSDATGAAAATPATFGTTAVRAVRDKATGQLRRATQAEVQELLAAEAAERQARGQPDPATAAPARQVTQHANGMLSAVLGTEHLVTVVAVRGPDGRLVRGHTHPAHAHPSSPAKPVQPQQRPTE
jgi:hypothetical protein